jgi:hypothetical protein
MKSWAGSYKNLESMVHECSWSAKQT